MPATSTLLDQAHNAIERKLFAMKGFYHPESRQQVFLTGLAHLYNLIPSQRRPLLISLTWCTVNTPNSAMNLTIKFFQVDNAGMLRMTSSARYFKEVVGSRRPN